VTSRPRSATPASRASRSVPWVCRFAWRRTPRRLRATRAGPSLSSVGEGPFATRVAVGLGDDEGTTTPRDIESAQSRPRRRAARERVRVVTNGYVPDVGRAVVPCGAFHQHRRPFRKGRAGARGVAVSAATRSVCFHVAPRRFPASRVVFRPPSAYDSRPCQARDSAPAACARSGAREKVADAQPRRATCLRRRARCRAWSCDASGARVAQAIDQSDAAARGRRVPRVARGFRRGVITESVRIRTAAAERDS